jgi:hypothetical protein
MNKRYGADLPAWILIGGLSCCALLIAYTDVSASGSLDALAVSFIFVSLLGFAWLLSFQIELTPSEIIFRSLFRGRRRIRNDQIKKVSLTCDFRKRTSGPLQLIVEPRDHSIQQLRINAKVFSRSAIDAVLKRGGLAAEADDGGLREGVFLPVFRGLRKGGLSTLRILVATVILLLGATALFVASFHSFETILFFWRDARRVTVEVCIFGLSIFLLFIGERLLGEHHWLRSIGRQLPLFVASFGLLGVMLYVWRAYNTRQPHSVTTYETIWFCLSLVGLALCTLRSRLRRKRSAPSTAR